MTILSLRVSELLLAQPETWMGSQVVEVVVHKSSSETEREHILVVNAEVALEQKGRIRVLRDGVSDSTKHLIEHSLASSSAQVSFRALARNEVQSAGLNAGFSNHTERPASDNPLEQSQSDEEFLRFSAFQVDRRIRPDGSIYPGTYATTMADGMAYVKTGTDAVARYALPNPDPAVNRFYLRPPRSVAIRRGRVAPANGQPGGGVEIIFETGCPAGTKYKQDVIPPV